MREQLGAMGTVKEGLEVEPCLGCGQTDFSQRCFGCRHDFRYLQPTQAMSDSQSFDAMAPSLAVDRG